MSAATRLAVVTRGLRGGEDIQQIVISNPLIVEDFGVAFQEDRILSEVQQGDVQSVVVEESYGATAGEDITVTVSQQSVVAQVQDNAVTVSVETPTIVVTITEE